MTQTVFTVGREVLRTYVSKIPRDDPSAALPWQELIKAVILWEDVSTDRLVGEIVGSITHNSLSGLQGGTTAEYYHLTSAQYTDLTDAGNSALHYHSTDRDSANFTGTNWTDLTDAGATTLHKHDHGGMDGLADDDHTQYVDTAGARTWTRPLVTTDGQYRGVIVAGTAGQNVTFGDLVYLKSDGMWYYTDADSAATAAGILLGLVCNTVAVSATMNVLVHGTMCETDWNWTVGGPLYVSVTAGDMQTAQPSGSGDIVRLVGYAYHADAVFFNPTEAWVEIV